METPRILAAATAKNRSLQAHVHNPVNMVIACGACTAHKTHGVAYI